MSQLDPTYKFILEAGMNVLVIVFLIVLVGGIVFVALRWIRYSDNALKAKKEGRDAENKAKKTEMELEEIRLKMVGELATQIASLTTQIGSQANEITRDREHDRIIREREMVVAEKLVLSADENRKLLGAYKADSEIFRNTMTIQSNATLLEVQQTTTTVKAIDDKVTVIHAGFSSVQDLKEVVQAFERALSDLPMKVQKILSPYCERMENALQKLETAQVEKEQQHDTHLGDSIQTVVDSHNINLGINPSDATTQHHGNGADDHSHERSGDAISKTGEPANDAPETDEVPDGNPTSESDSGSTTS